MQLQAILFDLWETLIHDAPELARRRYWRAEQVTQALARHDFAIGAEAVDKALGQAMGHLAQLQDQGRDLSSGGRALLFFDELEQGAERRPPESAIDEVELAITNLPEHLRPYEMPGARELLASIKALGLGTALVSNAGFTSAPNLRAMLDAYALRPNLDVLVFSDEMGFAKPDRRIFEAALAGLGVEAHACAFVGDSPHNDIAGAQALGMFGVKIGKREVDGVKPQLRIEALPELLPALARQGLVETSFSAPSE